MDTKISYLRPQSEEDWATVRPLFTRLYWTEDKTLPDTMEIMEEEPHRIKASLKMWKNKVKEWDLRKNLRKDEAQQMLNGAVPSGDAVHIPALTRKSEQVLVKRAKRSVNRKRARSVRDQEQSSPTPSEGLDDAETMLSPIADTSLVPARPLSQTIRIRVIIEQFLHSLRLWTHDAYLHGHWDAREPSEHNKGRRAARSLSSDLTAGTKLYEKGRHDLAWTYWKRAVAGLQAPDLFESWYHETPIRLLFEVSRVALFEEKNHMLNNGEHSLARTLLRSIGEWSLNHLKENDSRRALFGLFRELDVAQLRNLHGLAARCLYEGLESRLHKYSPLLYEVRLNRALDMLWYDPTSDVSEWLPPIEELDRFCGPNNSYSIYFLLLEAYRLISISLFHEADQACALARIRLDKMEEGSIDSWRLGMAYRRLGRAQYEKARYSDARRSFNTALKYVGNTSSSLSASIVVEIGHCQQLMASALNDQEDIELWTRVLQQLEQQAESHSKEVDELPPSRWLDQPSVVKLLTSKKSPPNRISSPSRSSTCIF